MMTIRTVEETSRQHHPKLCQKLLRRRPTQPTQKSSISDAGRRPPTPESGSQSRCATSPEITLGRARIVHALPYSSNEKVPPKAVTSSGTSSY